MRMVLKNIKAENFKKFKDVSFNFNEIGNEIYGENGSGKTTIIEMWLWLLCNKNYKLVDNPNVRPIDAEDGDITKVEATLDVDGRPLTISKYQKFKRSKPDVNGVVKTSTTNGYEVNTVEYSERDFKKKLSEDYGVDFEKILQLSHPDMFISGMSDKKGRDAMRKTLFEMASDFTDLDVAKMGKSTSDVAKMLENYTFEEIESMQKATMRKIRETYGKEGEIIDAEIRGIKKAKTEIDIEELEKTADDLEKQMSEVMQEITDSAVDTSDLQTELSSVKNKIAKIEDAAFDELRSKKRDASDRLLDCRNALQKVQGDITHIDGSVKQNEDVMARIKGNLNELKQKLEDVKKEEFNSDEWVFDENTTICSLCGQKLPDAKIEELKTDFTSRKENAESEFKAWKDTEIERLVKEGKEETTEYKGIKKITDEIISKRKTLEKEKKSIEENLKVITEEVETIPEKPDLSNNKEYKALLEKQIEVENAIEKAKGEVADTSILSEKYQNLKCQYDATMSEIGRAKVNDDIDNNIKELNEKKRQLAQEKADCEKILYQLSLVSKKKNETLEESVNSHFKLVRFKLFDIQKNGEVKDACIPMIDGYQFEKSTNTGRDILAKLDIIEGLQKYFNQHYPVFLDGAEALSKVTADRIRIDGQIMMMTVSEDKELKFKERN